MTESPYSILAELLLLRLKQTRFDPKFDARLNSLFPRLCEISDKLLSIPEVRQAAENLRAAQLSAERELEISNLYRDLISALKAAAQSNSAFREWLEEFAPATQSDYFLAKYRLVIIEGSFLTGNIDGSITIRGSASTISTGSVAGHFNIGSTNSNYYTSTNVGELLTINNSAKDSRNPSLICHIYAEMDERVILNRVTSLEVIISGDKLEWQDSATGKGGEVSVDPQKRLLIQAVAKTNLVICSLPSVGHAAFIPPNS